MNKPNVEDYLEKGIYGVKQTKPEERKKYLGTLRERIVVALTKGQVMEKGIYPEVEQLMKDHPNATLLLNGSLNYQYISDYISTATRNNISFSIVTDKNNETDIGLVLTYNYAIDKEEIFIQKEENKLQTAPKSKKSFLSGLVSFLKK